MSNNNCMSYLEILVHRFKDEIDKAIANGERPPARSKELWIECNKRKNTIMAACAQEAMSPEEYKGI
jgi:hypothetical protein